MLKETRTLFPEEENIIAEVRKNEGPQAAKLVERLMSLDIETVETHRRTNTTNVRTDDLTDENLAALEKIEGVQVEFHPEMGGPITYIEVPDGKIDEVSRVLRSQTMPTFEGEAEVYENPRMEKMRQSTAPTQPPAAPGPPVTPPEAPRVPEPVPPAEQPWEMNESERASEIERLRRRNREALAAPLVSEGAISATQINRMGKREYTKWQKNTMRRMEVESQIRLLENPEEAKRRADAQNKQKASGRVAQLRNRIEDLSRLGVGKRGTIRPTYQKQIDAAQKELAEVLADYPDLISDPAL